MKKFFVLNKNSLLIYIIIILSFVFFYFFLKENSQTFINIKRRGVLNCGVSQKLEGFSVLNEERKWVGFNVDICRAVAIAIFGNPDQIQFFPILTIERLSALQTRKVDLLVQNITWTLEEDSVFDFAGITHYDGIGFMVPKKLGVKSAKELDGAKICLQTTNEINISGFFRSNKIRYEPISFKESHKIIQAYISGLCDVVTASMF